MKWTPGPTALLVAKWNAGLPEAEIAQELGVSRSAVAGRVRRLGLPPRDRSTVRPSRSYDWKTYQRSGVSLRLLSFEKSYTFDVKDSASDATSDAHAHERAKAAAKQAGQS